MQIIPLIELSNKKIQNSELLEKLNQDDLLYIIDLDAIEEDESNLDIYQSLSKQYKIKFPNTNNSLEGSFAHLKDKVRLHRGLKLNRKLKLINQILIGKAPENYH